MENFGTISFSKNVMDKFRIEKDSIGKIKVPYNAYYGSFTARALKNFQISGITASKYFKEAIGIIKFIAAKTNAELDLLNKKHANTIMRAAEEFIQGKFDSDYKIDVFQAGAGTPFNMNANEIIANRANELLGTEKGKYNPVHPNDHVNMSQSSNDVIPSAMRIAIILASKEFLKNLKDFRLALLKKSHEFKNILKVGRTHMQDAVPITLGQEFGAYAEAINKDFINIQNSLKNMYAVGIGGTAIGTGINTDPRYKKLFVKNLNDYMHLKFKNEKNLVESNQNASIFVYFASALKALAYNLIRISNDLKLLNMGPRAGIAEITLPEVEPGSSIMPGKLNASILECLQMIALQVIGNEHTISTASQLGSLELNTMTPVIIFNILWSLELLTNGLRMTTNLCVNGIKANVKTCRRLFEKSLSAATILNPYIGYQKTAEIVKKALLTGKSIKEIVIMEKLISKQKLDEIFQIKHITKPYNIKNMLKGLKRG